MRQQIHSSLDVTVETGFGHPLVIGKDEFKKKSTYKKNKKKKLFVIATGR